MIRLHTDDKIEDGGVAVQADDANADDRSACIQNYRS